MKRTSVFYLLLSYLLLVTACQDDPEFTPTEKFLRIFDDQDYNAVYKPLSIVENSTGGLVILSETSLENSVFSGSNLLLADSVGDIFSAFTVDQNYGAPVGELMEINGQFYFACMNLNTLAVHLVPVSERGVAGTPVPVSGGLTYPLASAVTQDGNIMLLSYDARDRNSVVSKVSTDGTLLQSASYSVGTANDAEPLIFSHFTDPASRLPFFVGELADGTAYFNGFFNYTLSLVFSRYGEDPQGIIQGQQTFTGIKSLQPLAGNRFSLVGFQRDANYLRPGVSLNTGEITSSVDLFTTIVPEIRPYAPVKSLLINTESGNQVVVTATETQNRQTVLYFHSTEGNLLDISYLGSLNPFTLGDLAVSPDGSLLVTGTTFVSSRFERIYINKIPSAELSALGN